jgi:hypothetical protein
LALAAEIMLVMMIIYTLILESRHGIADNGDMGEGF